MFFDSELFYFVWVFSLKYIQFINCIYNAIKYKFSEKKNSPWNIIMRSVKKDVFGGHEPEEVQHFACVISCASFFFLQWLAYSMVSFPLILFLLELAPLLIVVAN